MMAQQDNRPMDLNRSQALLGGLSPATFMRRHWHKKPLLVRQAIAGAAPPFSRTEMFALAARDDVESRLIRRDAGERWHLRHGPLPRRALPPLAQPGWTLLVQGVDLHLDAAHELLARFAFIPAARLDDLMLSYAGDGGGVGPHVDSYDVFLLQVHGRRRWRISRLRDARLRDDVPLKMLAHFEPEQEWLLEPGDMLYLPPGWAHDGVAVGGDCMTASIGFRAPRADELAQALLARLADGIDASERAPRYRDPGQSATATPGAIPAALQAFTQRALARALADPALVGRTLGEWLTEPKAQVWFDAGAGQNGEHGVQLDRRSRMAYDDRHIFINGESLRASGRDARLMRLLADQRQLGAASVRGASPAARALIGEWLTNGWLRATDLNRRQELT
jgi:50S ribosomal protein L16 3-hydroxylase